MPEALTYDSLLTDLEDYCERSDADFIAQCPRFVMLAESRLASEARGLGFQRYVTGSLASSTIPKPERWRETVSLNITVGGQRVYLFPRSYDYCRVYAADVGATAQPRYYADYGYEHLFVAPSPDTTYPFELAYFERPVPLSLSEQVNWTTQYAPQLLLYACLLEAAPFLKRPDLMQQWQGAYDRALQALGTETSRQFSDRTQQRTSV